jgi:hypothetical protein
LKLGNIHTATWDVAAAEYGRLKKAWQPVRCRSSHCRVPNSGQEFEVREALINTPANGATGDSVCFRPLFSFFSAAVFFLTENICRRLRRSGCYWKNKKDKE